MSESIFIHPNNFIQVYRNKTLVSHVVQNIADYKRFCSSFNLRGSQI